MKRRRRASFLQVAAPAFLIAAALSLPAAAARQAPSGRPVRNPVWGVALRVPMYEPVDHPLQEQANFVLAGRGGSGACRLNLSLFVAPVKEGATPDECRKGDIGDPEAIALRPDAELVDEGSGAVAWSLFDQTFESRGGLSAVYHHLYGYKTRNDLCFQLHLSSDEGCPDFPRRAKGVLGSLRLERDPGATLETSELARREGGDARDWRLHLKVADAYLRDETRRNPARARRFYASAARLAGARLRPADRFAIDQGLGLAWLQEENGKEAIAPLKRAAQATGRARPGVSEEAVRETLYALAAANALAGEIDASCAAARGWLQGAEAEGLKPAAKRIRKDAHMEALTDSECYRALLTDLGLR